MIAYAPALRVGFIQDDFIWLRDSRAFPAPDLWTYLLPAPDLEHWFFYRPVSDLLTWKLGYLLWGFNPFPYHLIGLLLHAGTATFLALWLAAASARPVLGWLAGSLFAVYPLHMEVVAWLSAQWDAWALFFGLLSLWMFTVWWRTGRTRLYLLALLSYGLGVFSKESLLTFLPLFAVSVWYTSPRQVWSFSSRQLARLGLALVPFAAVLASNLALRYLRWGTTGGYPTARQDYTEFIWDAFVSWMRLLVAPINGAVFGQGAVQVGGLVLTLLLLAGLIAFGWRERRLLVLAGIWIALALVPVINLPLSRFDLNFNRLAYVMSAGYCVLLAALLYQGLLAAQWRTWAKSVVGLLLLVGAIMSWLQLVPWHTVTLQTERVRYDLARMISVQPRPAGAVFYTEGRPPDYKGVPGLFIGLGEAYMFASGDVIPDLAETESFNSLPLAPEARDAFGLRFKYIPQTELFTIDRVVGIVNSVEKLSSGTSQEGHLWDFRQCSQDVIAAWTIDGATARCDRGIGLIIAPGGGDTKLIGPDLSLVTGAGDKSWFRLGAAVTYPDEREPEPFVYQWYWRGNGAGFNEESSLSSTLKQDGKAHTYWSVLPASDTGSIEGLRFDPINRAAEVTIAWLSIEKVR